MKRASVSFGQSPAVDDEDKAKLKYQTLLNEYLELQKECVSRKRKLPAAKKKRRTLLSELRSMSLTEAQTMQPLNYRFLRHRRKSLMKASASNVEKLHLHQPNPDIETNSLERGRNQPTKAVQESSDKVPVTKSNVKDKEEERNQQVSKEELQLSRNPINFLDNDKGTGKRKISWPGRVTLKI